MQVATGCQEDESVCLCDNKAYISWIETCLTTNCPADKVEAMKAEIKDSCDLIREYISTAVDPSSSTSSPRPSGIAGAASSISSLTSIATVTPVGSATARPSASPSASGVAALPSAASSISSAASSARASASSSSSSAGAMPTAMPGVMGVLAVAAGAMMA